jgi:hypothetical protein
VPAADRLIGMIWWLVILFAYAVFVYFARPSKKLGKVIRKEFNPTPDEEVLQLLRRGHKYNSVGGLKGVHVWTTVLTVVFVLPLWIVSVCLETVYDGAKQGSAEGKPRRR